MNQSDENILTGIKYHIDKIKGCEHCTAAFESLVEQEKNRKPHNYSESRGNNGTIIRESKWYKNEQVHRDFDLPSYIYECIEANGDKAKTLHWRNQGRSMRSNDKAVCEHYEAKAGEEYKLRFINYQHNRSDKTKPNFEEYYNDGSIKSQSFLTDDPNKSIKKEFEQCELFPSP